MSPRYNMWINRWINNSILLGSRPLHKHTMILPNNYVLHTNSLLLLLPSTTSLLPPGGASLQPLVYYISKWIPEALRSSLWLLRLSQWHDNRMWPAEDSEGSAQLVDDIHLGGCTAEWEEVGKVVSPENGNPLEDSWLVILELLWSRSACVCFCCADIIRANIWPDTVTASKCTFVPDNKAAWPAVQPTDIMSAEDESRARYSTHGQLNSTSRNRILRR